jgi:hypothetical protein
MLEDISETWDSYRIAGKIKYPSEQEVNRLA